MSYDTFVDNNNVYIDQYPQQQQNSQQLNQFDFENTDDFLYSISGVLPDTTTNYNNNINDNTNYINSNIYSPLSNSGDDEFITQQQQQQSSSILGDDNLNFNFNNTQTFNPIIEQEQDDLFSNKRSHSTSTVTYTNENVTPNSHISNDSSNLTTPEPLTDRKLSNSKKSNKVVKPIKNKDKNSHNMIEKKYRTNINLKILALRDAVPSLRIAAGCNDLTIADLEGLTPASKLNKASVLTKATEYIKHLENKNEMLKQQNSQLIKLIQQANLNPQREMGFYPQQYNQIQSPQSSQSSNTQSPQQQPNKLLLGGMAAVMGTSLFGGSGENDFRSLSALPFSSYIFPNALLNPSNITIQLWNLTKLLLVIGSLASLIIPMIQNYKKEDPKKSDFNLIDWVLIIFGFKLPNKLSDSKKSSILQNLQNNSDFNSLIKDYFYLQGCEINFENLFLSLIICGILKKQFKLISPVINHFMIIKSSLIMNLDYKGSNKSLIKLNQLIGKVDGCYMFDSNSLIQRLINLKLKNSINYNITDGKNYIKYIELYQKSQSYYEIILNWRLLEIIHDLNIIYLNNLIQQDDEDKDTEILTDLKILKVLIGDLKISEYLQLFISIINSNQSPYLFQSLQSKVESNLEKFKIINEGAELTDGELSDEEEEPKEEIEISIRSQKSLISSLNLISQDEFIILTSSLIIYYYNNEEYQNVLKLLNYLSKISSTNFNLFSFTSLITLITKIIPGKINDNENLDHLIKITRIWLNDHNEILDENLNEGLIKVIVKKSMILKGIDDDNE